MTGRGLAALSAPGQIYQLELKEGEEFVAHPGSVVAYAVTRNPPQPFRFKSSSLRIQVPSLARLVPDAEWMKTVRNSEAYKFFARTLYKIRTATRRTIWGDRLFLQFHGPTTILMSSRGARASDVLSSKQINEIADAPAGVLAKAVELSNKPKQVTESVVDKEVVVEASKDITTKAAKNVTSDQSVTGIHIGTVGKDGKVKFEDSKDLKEVIR